jgi:hypothetical protein
MPDNGNGNGNDSGNGGNGSPDITVVKTSIRTADAEEAVSMRHEHDNISVLEKFGEDGGEPTFDGHRITAEVSLEAMTETEMRDILNNILGV